MKSGLFDRNGNEFIDGSMVDMVEWDDEMIIKVAWNQEQARFEARNSHGVAITDMKSLVVDGVITNAL
jgi:hypothetical protein